MQPADAALSAQINEYFRRTTVVTSAAKAAPCSLEMAERIAEGNRILFELILAEVRGDDREEWIALLAGPTADLDCRVRWRVRGGIIDRARVLFGSRRRRRRVVCADALERRTGSEFSVQAVAGACELVEHHAELRRLRAALEKLPAHERDAIERRLAAEETGKARQPGGEGKARTEPAASTSRRHYALGLKRLRRELSKVTPEWSSSAVSTP